MKKRSTTLLLLIVIAFGYSQETPILKVKDKPLGLSSLDIKVEIVGNIATTTYDMLFYNPANQVLEGELSFPLGEGHDVSRFALDVNGKLREAVVVDKELGRIAFEQVVRRGVDPALLEKGTGNNYKARIYPIPANGYKRVLVAYEQELVFSDGGQHYNLPLNFKNKLDFFKLEIVVFDQKDKPVVEKGLISGLEFSNWEKNYRTSVTKKNYIPNKNLLIKIPMPVYSEKVITFNDYFYVYKTLSPQKRLRKKPNKIAMFWDASFSMKERNLEKEMSLLNDFFKHIKDVTVCFVSFSNTILSDTEFIIKDGNWDALKKKISHTIYDGGTSYDVLINEKNDADMTLLFSDGITSLSNNKLEYNKPIYIVNSLTKSNHSSLNNMAELSKGAYINLTTKSESEAISSIKYKAYKFLGYKSDSKIIEIYPKAPLSISNDFSISGRNAKDGDVIILNFGYDNEVTQSVTINISASETPNNNIRRIWAQKKLDDLEIKSKENKAQITKLGTDFSLVTDFTSLIVLEDVTDYITYKITPPEELLEEYNKMLAVIESEKDKRNEKLSFSISSPSAAPNNMLIVDDEMDIEEEIIISGTSLGLMNSSELDEVVAVSEERSSYDYTKYQGDLTVKERRINTEYLVSLYKTKNIKDAYQVYLSQRGKYINIPAYFVDVSNYFKERFNEFKYSSRILSNISETDFDNYELLKVFAYQLQVNKQDKLALFIFKRILELRPEDSQSYRDLALAFEKMGMYQEALDLFNSIINGEIYKNTQRRIFQGVKDISENEISHLVQNFGDDLNFNNTDKKFLKGINYDLRITVDWNHNDTDIDLHIIDPNLEECFYSHAKTKIGGQMSPDMTQGFGPEEFILKKAIKGDYFVKIKYYGDRYQKVENPTFMKVTIFKHYGSKKESKEIKIIRLTQKDDEEVIAKLSF
jgi:Vault protein inter-alpha-trypsin domain/Uncharacterized protein conserved in bacteria (DUF2135)